jgi:glycosyltransferase involved in cell wall biosynthesis
MAEPTSQRRRVLIVAYECSPASGSEAGNAWNWAVHLDRAGWDVELLTSGRSSGEISAALTKATRSTSLHEVPRPGRTPRTQLGGYIRYLRWQRAALERCRASGLLQQVDVIHHVTWSSLYWGSRFHGRGVPPLVFGPIGGGQVASAIQGTPMSLRDRLAERLRTAAITSVRWNPLARSTMRAAREVLVTNHETAAVARSLGASCVTLQLDSACPPQTLASPVVPAAQRTRFRCSWIGRLIGIKDPVLAVEVLAEVVARVPGAHMDMLGDGAEMGRLCSTITDLGLDGHVTVRGRVPWTEVLDHLDDTRLLLVTSLRESSGAQALEALGRGVPVVTIDQFGLGAFLPRESSSLVPPGRRRLLVNGLAESVCQLLLLSDAEWDQLSARSREAAESMNWAEAARRFTALVDSWET